MEVRERLVFCFLNIFALEEFYSIIEFRFEREVGGVKAWIDDGSIWVTGTYVSDSPCSGKIPAEICVSSTVWWSNDRTLVEFQSYFPNLHKENTEKGTSHDFDIYTRDLKHT